MTSEFRITRPDDFHVHLRNDPYVTQVAMEKCGLYGRAVVMGNLKLPPNQKNGLPWDGRPVMKRSDVVLYRTFLEQVRKGTYGRSSPEFLMTLMLTDETEPDWIAEAADSIFAVKAMPRHGTTNSVFGVSTLRTKRMGECFEVMRDKRIPLLVHGEDPSAFVLDREAAFLKDLAIVASEFDRLKIVLEHVSSRAGVKFVKEMGQNVAATITAHHLVLTLNDVIGGLLQPHAFCKPVAKRPEDRAALIEAATSNRNRNKFFFGSDSAPHLRKQKECSDGCAGIFVPDTVAIGTLAEVFEAAGRLEALESFVSIRGAEFYELAPNKAQISLQRGSVTGDRVIFSNLVSNRDFDDMIPFRAGQTIGWRVTG